MQRLLLGCEIGVRNQLSYFAKFVDSIIGNNASNLKAKKDILIKQLFHLVFH